MPPKGRGRKRPISVSNLVGEIRAEVEQDIKNCEKLEQFKKSLKTFLFSPAYNCS